MSGSLASAAVAENSSERAQSHEGVLEYKFLIVEVMYFLSYPFFGSPHQVFLWQSSWQHRRNQEVKQHGIKGLLCFTGVWFPITLLVLRRVVFAPGIPRWLLAQTTQPALHRGSHCVSLCLRPLGFTRCQADTSLLRSRLRGL